MRHLCTHTVQTLEFRLCVIDADLGLTSPTELQSQQMLTPTLSSGKCYWWLQAVALYWHLDGGKHALSKNSGVAGTEEELILVSGSQDKTGQGRKTHRNGSAGLTLCPFHQKISMLNPNTDLRVFRIITNTSCYNVAMDLKILLLLWYNSIRKWLKMAAGFQTPLNLRALNTLL